MMSIALVYYDNRYERRRFAALTPGTFWGNPISPSPCQDEVAFQG